MAQTMALTTLVVLELIRVQIIRAQYHMSLFANRWLLFALVGSLALQLGVIYFSPLQKIFGTAPLGRMEWIVIVVIALLVGGVSHGISKLFQFPCRLKT
jgi:Ca2+-transporting ATPase